MAKEIPGVAVASSVPPDVNREYFEDGGAGFAFVPDAMEFELRNAWWMAEASFAAYGAFDSEGKTPLKVGILPAAGYEIEAGAAGDTQLLAITNKEVLIVAFRGTRLSGFKLPFLNGIAVSPHWGDVVTDARFIPARVEDDVFVHEGFLAAYRAIEKRSSEIVERALTAGKRVWFCGHSLGAALATLAAYTFRKQAQGLYTFGSPRVGNAAFANKLIADLPNIHRVVHHRDVVTTVPPEGFDVCFDVTKWPEIVAALLKGKPLGYAHVGNLRYISGGSENLKITEGESARLRIKALAADAYAHAKQIADVLTKGFSPLDPSTWPILVDVLSDHAPVYYANKIFNFCEQERSQR